MHRELGATLVDFHGWEMPIRYTSIPEEHRRVRESAGLFDLCHMGRLEVSGPDADSWIDGLITNDLTQIGVGDARYTLITTESGTIIDDAIVYRLPDRLFMVVNASNRASVLEWLHARREDADAELVDRTSELAMIAIQGPRARSIAEPLFSDPSRPFDDLKYYQILEARLPRRTGACRAYRIHGRGRIRDLPRCRASRRDLARAARV